MATGGAGNQRLVELVRRALAAVHGIDLNPFAVAIARFRLLVAALRAAGIARVRSAPVWPLNVFTGDSLLFGPEPGQQVAGELLAAAIRDGVTAPGFQNGSSLIVATTPRIRLRGAENSHSKIPGFGRGASDGAPATNQPRIVGRGNSASGLKVFSQLLEHLSVATGVVLIVELALGQSSTFWFRRRREPFYESNYHPDYPTGGG